MKKSNIRVRRFDDSSGPQVVVESESGSWAVSVDKDGIPTFTCRDDRGYGLVEDWPGLGVSLTMPDPIMQANIVGYEESRDIEKEYNLDGTIREMKPVVGSEKSFLTLELQEGARIKAQIPYEDFERHIVPALKLQEGKPRFL